MDEEDAHFLSASHRKCILLSGTECHIINYLLTELARAVPGNIGTRSFLYGPRCAKSLLSRPRTNIPQYGPRARLVRGYYIASNLTSLIGKNCLRLTHLKKYSFLSVKIIVYIDCLSGKKYHNTASYN